MIAKGSFTGNQVALVTPFRKDLSIDKSALRAHADFVLKQPLIGGIVLAGFNGEGHLINETQFKDICQAANGIKAGHAGKNVLLGIMRQEAKDAYELARITRSLYVDGVLVAPPLNYEGDSQGIVNFFQDIQRIAQKPIIAYNTGKARKPLSMEEMRLILCRIGPDFIGIKDSRQDSLLAEYLANGENFEFNFIEGNDRRLATTFEALNSLRADKKYFGGIANISGSSNAHYFLGKIGEMYGSISEGEKVQTLQNAVNANLEIVLKDTKLGEPSIWKNLVRFNGISFPAGVLPNRQEIDSAIYQNLADWHGRLK